MKAARLPEVSLALLVLIFGGCASRVDNQKKPKPTPQAVKFPIIGFEFGGVQTTAELDLHLDDGSTGLEQLAAGTKPIRATLAAMNSLAGHLNESETFLDEASTREISGASVRTLVTVSTREGFGFHGVVCKGAVPIYSVDWSSDEKTISAFRDVGALRLPEDDTYKIESRPYKVHGSYSATDASFTALGYTEEVATDDAGGGGGDQAPAIKRIHDSSTAKQRSDGSFDFAGVTDRIYDISSETPGSVPDAYYAGRIGADDSRIEVTYDRAYPVLCPKPFNPMALASPGWCGGVKYGAGGIFQSVFFGAATDAEWEKIKEAGIRAPSTLAPVDLGGAEACDF